MTQLTTKLGAAVVLTASLFAATSAQAAKEGIYVGADIGYNFADDQDSTGPSRNVDIEFEDDIFYTGSVGYAFAPGEYGQPAIELEAAYRENDVENLNFNGGVQSPVGDQSVFSVLVNGKWHFTQLSDDIIPFVGAGVGFANIDASVRYGPVANINDDDTVFAYQLLAGAAVPLNENLSIVGTARYFDLAEDPELNRFGGPAPVRNTLLDSEYSSFGLSVGLKYAF